VMGQGSGLLSAFALALTAGMGIGSFYIRLSAVSFLSDCRLQAQACLSEPV